MANNMQYDWSISSKKVSNVAHYQQSIGFDAGGNRYICVCGIVSEDGDKITIDNNNINRFEWTNEVNNLCINGFAEIVDTNGRVGEVFSKYFCHMVFEIKKLQDNAKRTDGQFDGTGTSDAIFRHAFIINNFEIVKRTKQVVLYRLYLIGIEWYGLVQNLIFSNYDMKLPEQSKSNEFIKNMTEWIPGDFGKNVGNALNNNSAIGGILNAANSVSKLTSSLQSKMSGGSGGSSGGGSSGSKPIEIFAIIKYFLEEAFKNEYIYHAGEKPQVDKDAFESHKSKIDINVCFGHNFTIIDCIKFLLNKLYYNEFNGENLIHDEKLKLLVYDEFKNIYGVINYGVDTEFITSSKDTMYNGTWESLFGSQFESLTEPVEQNLKSTVKKSTIDALKQFFKKTYHYFTLDGFKDKLIKSEEIIDYSHKDDSFPKDVGYQEYLAKMNIDIFKKFFPDDKFKYDVHGSEWNNDFTIYLDQVTDLINKDVLILYTKGDITHRPGMKFGITDDSVAQNDIEANAKDAKEAKNASKEIIGLFNVVKVKHIVNPNSNEKDTFMEELSLSRNFVAKQK